MLAGLLFVGGGLGLVAIDGLLRLRGQRLSLGAPIQRSDWGWLTPSILSGGVVAPVLLMFGLASSPASTAALLLNFEGVFTVLIAWAAFGERLTQRFVVGIAMITAGGIILSQPQTGLGFSWGSLAILGTCFAWGLDSNLTHKIADRDSLQLSILKCGVAGMINVMLAFAVGDALPRSTLLPIVLGLGFLGYGLTLLCFVLALRHIGAARTGAMFALSPFVSATIAVLLLSEPVTLDLLVAASVMAIGVFFCVHRPTPQP